MRTPIIAGNWKMNKTADEALAFVRQIRNELNNITSVESVVCPPFIALPSVADALKGTRIAIGAQNVHYENNGAFTGEIAADMLVPYCQYVIIGHSERRAYFCETDDTVNKKAKQILSFGMIPIICVGESLEQNEAGKTHDFVSRQVKAALSGLTPEQTASCVIAYEPIWAIGTGKSASAADAGLIIGRTVRGAVADEFGEETAQLVRVQYGGSAKPSNIGEYMSHPDIDGALVGGASLKPTFVEMVQVTASVNT